MPIINSSMANQRRGFFLLSIKGAKTMLPTPMPKRKVASMMVKA